MEFTGKELNYLHVCHRKLWLYRHGIQPELESDLVQLGMLLGEQSFSRQEKDIAIGDNAVLDWADFKDGVIHETKRGPAPGGGDEAQVRFYMSVLNSNGVPVREAVIHYPTKRKTVTVPWNQNMAELVKADIAECEAVVSGPVPPAERKAFCRNCAYEEMCFI